MCVFNGMSERYLKTFDRKNKTIERRKGNKGGKRDREKNGRRDGGKI